MATTTISVEGMTCDHCVRAVREAVLGVGGVEGAEVDLASGTAEVRGPGFEVAALIDAIADEGYTATPEPTSTP